MVPAGLLTLIVSLLFVGSQAEDKARGDWLCAQVRQYQKTHPLSNVIAFAAGDFRFNGPIDAADIVYEVNGCNQGVGGLGSAMIGGTVGDIANEFGPAVLPGAGRRIGDAVVNYMNPCKKFKMVAFADGSFTRRGDGGFENWCFSGQDFFCLLFWPLWGASIFVGKVACACAFGSGTQSNSSS